MPFEARGGIRILPTVDVYKRVPDNCTDPDAYIAFLETYSPRKSSYADHEAMAKKLYCTGSNVA